MSTRGLTRVSLVVLALSVVSLAERPAAATAYPAGYVCAASYTPAYSQPALAYYYSDSQLMDILKTLENHQVANRRVQINGSPTTQNGHALDIATFN